MTSPDHIMVVRDFLLAGVCKPCRGVLRRDPALEGFIAAALKPQQPEPQPEVRQVDERLERGFGVYVVLAWFVMGWFCCWFWTSVVGWLGGAK